MLLASLILIAIVGAIGPLVAERRRALRGPDGELETFELLGRQLGGAVHVPRDVTGSPVIDGATLLGKVEKLRAWAELRGFGPFDVAASVEIDPALELEIRRPELFVRKRRAKTSTDVQPQAGTAIDLRFDVRTARDRAGDVGEALFVHAGERITEPLQRLLYSLGVDAVHAARGRLSVTFEARSSVAEATREALRSLAAIALAYQRKAAGPPIGGIVERYLWLDGASPRCPYCHSDIAEGESGLVVCGKCKTLHHEVCFSENGRCTLLGCSGTEAKPSAPPPRA